MKFNLYKRAIGLPAIVLLGVTVNPAWCDQWSGALTPTNASIQNYSGVLNIFVTGVAADGTFLNPAACAATDAYASNDPLLVKEMLAMSLTAISIAHQIKLYVSSTQCVQSRPMIVSFQMN